MSNFQPRHQPKKKNFCQEYCFLPLNKLLKYVVEFGNSYYSTSFHCLGVFCFCENSIFFFFFPGEGERGGEGGGNE